MVKKLLIAVVITLFSINTAAAKDEHKGSLITAKSNEVSDAGKYKGPTRRELDPPTPLPDYCKEKGHFCDDDGVLLCDITAEWCREYHTNLTNRIIINFIDESGNITDKRYKRDNRDLYFSDDFIIIGAIDGYGTSAYVTNSEGKVIGETFGDGIVYHYLGLTRLKRIYYRGNQDDAIGQLNDEGVAFDKDGNIIGRISENVFVDNRGEPRCDTDNKWCRDYCEKNCPKKQAQYKKEHPIASALHKLITKFRSYTIHRKQMPESSYDIRP